MLNNALTLQGIRVLFLENDDDVIDLYTLIFEMEGMLVQSATSSQQALEILEELPINIIISDIYLSDENGYAFMSKWRRREAERGLAMIPAIAVSGVDSCDGRVLASAAGFQDYVQKPVDPEILIRLIAKWCLSA